MKTIIAFILISITLFASSCSSDKDIILNGKNQTFEAYGWANDELKNDSIEYHIVVGNVVWSVIGCETIIIPIWLTGWNIKEPIKVKAQYAHLNLKNK